MRRQRPSGQRQKETDERMLRLIHIPESKQGNALHKEDNDIELFLFHVIVLKSPLDH